MFERFGTKPPAKIGEIYTSFLADPGGQACRGQLSLRLPPVEAIAKLKVADIVLLSSATNLDEAERAVAAGIDAIVAQGYEAGGHRGIFDPAGPDSQLGVTTLTRLLISRLSVPVIAARLDLGAGGRPVGHGLHRPPRSSADRFCRDALFGPGAAVTEVTDLISGRPARCLPNAFTALKDTALKGVTAPDYPIAYDAGRAKGDDGLGAQWAGQGAPLAAPCRPRTWSPRWRRNYRRPARSAG